MTFPAIFFLDRLGFLRLARFGRSYAYGLFSTKGLMAAAVTSVVIAFVSVFFV